MYLNHQKEGGFVLIVAMLILLLLSVIGITVIRTANTDLQIAGNDRRAKHAFYKADGGTEAAIEMLEENLACPGGFQAPATFNNDDASTFLNLGGVDVFDVQFAGDLSENDIPRGSSLPAPTGLDLVPSDSYRTLRISDDLSGAPASRNDVAPHINLAVFGTSGFAHGSALQMSAGYQGLGYSTAGGGGIKKMDIYSRYDGPVSATAKIFLEYVHLIGSEGSCRY